MKKLNLVLLALMAFVIFSCGGKNVNGTKKESKVLKVGM